MTSGLCDSEVILSGGYVTWMLYCMTRRLRDPEVKWFKLGYDVRGGGVCVGERWIEK